MRAPEWTNEVIWYAIYPLGIVGAPKQATAETGPSHRLGRIEAWLDHLIVLGCNGLALGPIFASRSHGYDTLDYFRIDPRLGDDADFDHLVQACHDRGIRVLLDGVFNHVSADYPELVEALADPNAPNAGWFHIDFSTSPPTRLNFEGSDDLVRLNHASPDVVKLVGDVMTHWLARGIDGWRLDAAYAVDPQFWAQVLDRVRAEYPQALFVGEVIHTDLARVSAATVDSITAYELWKSTWSAINDRNFFELDWTMTRHDELLELVRPLTFVSNHDVTRIISKVGPQGALLALVVLATVGGMPSIYYGDEGGLPGIKYERPGGDDEVRPEMPAAPLDWQMPHPEIWQAHRALIALRRKHPWLVDARHEAVKVDSERYVYKMTAGDQWLQVELDMTEGCAAVVRDAAGEAYRH